MEVEDEFKLPDEICEYGESDIFKIEPNMIQEEASGLLVVCGEGEELALSNEEWQLLARGPKYCVVRGVVKRTWTLK